MKGFELHPRLTADTHLLGRLDLSLVLLHRDAEVPGYLLVPTLDAAEAIDLAAAEREPRISYRARPEGAARPRRAFHTLHGHRMP